MIRILLSLLLVSLVAGNVYSEEKPRGEKGRFLSTHVIARAAVYYTSGPQQGRPPDGRLPAGTEVKLVRRSGSYALIQTESGIRGFVATAAMKRKSIPVPRDVAEVARSNNRFAVGLYQQLAAGKKGNLFFSPSSISAALAMTYAGAEGRTEKEMADVLQFKLPEDRLHSAQRQFSNIMNADDKDRGYELQVANRLWGQQGYGFRPEYLKVTRDNYAAELAEVDFIRKTEATRKTINSWVEKQTKGKIKDLIPQGSLDALTRLVLTNAIYFKGDWTTPFDAKKTKDAPFHLTKTEKIDVPLMFHKDKFRYGEAKDLQILQLPYGKDELLSMVVLLPKDVDGLLSLEKSLSEESLAKQIAGLRSREVMVFLPKFKMTSEFELSKVLRTMGMPTAFTPGAADFSGMSTNEKLYISAVIHKAFVDVNEKGTEAAAATGVVIRATSAPPPPPTFRADRPFAFLIRDNRTGAFLFLGRVVNPKSAP